MLEGICRVCGSPLSLPLVTCPDCATPHHQDCWEYNRGCTIYACTGTAALANAYPTTIPDGLPAAPTSREPAQLVRLTTGLFAVLAAAKLLGPLATIVCAGALAGWASRRREPAIEPVETRIESLTLETKEVSRLVGENQPQQLAQTYALFEQRNPRASLPGELQGQLALELLSSGHLVLGLEALDKTIPTLAPVERHHADELRRKMLHDDPAFFEEALIGEAGDRKRTLTPLLSTFAEACFASPRDGDSYILTGTSRGFGAELCVATQIPGIPGKRHVSAHIAGPFEPANLDHEVSTRIDGGAPCFVVPACALELSAIEPVRWIHISQKGIRIRHGAPLTVEEASAPEGRRGGDETECFFDWDEVVEVFYARLDTVSRQSQLVREDHFGPRGSRATEYKTVKTDAVHTRPIVEIVAGTLRRRFRIDYPEFGLFDYLGRRRESSHAFNAGLVVKDVVRFGPRVRASQGVHCLFGERTGVGLHFGNAVAFEHGRVWFNAVGSEHVLAQWAAVAKHTD